MGRIDGAYPALEHLPSSDMASHKSTLLANRRFLTEAVLEPGNHFRTRQSLSVTLLKTSALCLTLLAIYALQSSAPSWWIYSPSGILSKEVEIGFASVCPQAEPVKLSRNAKLQQELDDRFRSSKFRLHAFESLGGVVRIP